MADEDILFHLTALFFAGWTALVVVLWATDRTIRAKHVETFRLYDQLRTDLAAFERNAASEAQSRLPPTGHDVEKTTHRAIVDLSRIRRNDARRGGSTPARRALRSRFASAQPR